MYITENDVLRDRERLREEFDGNIIYVGTCMHIVVRIYRYLQHLRRANMYRVYAHNKYVVVYTADVIEFLSQSRLYFYATIIHCIYVYYVRYILQVIQSRAVFIHTHTYIYI